MSGQWAYAFGFFLLVTFLLYWFGSATMLNHNPHIPIVPEPWDTGAPSESESYDLMTGEGEE